MINCTKWVFHPSLAKWLYSKILIQLDFSKSSSQFLSSQRYRSVKLLLSTCKRKTYQWSKLWEMLNWNVIVSNIWSLRENSKIPNWLIYILCKHAWWQIIILVKLAFSPSSTNIVIKIIIISIAPTVNSTISPKINKELWIWMQYCQWSTSGPLRFCAIVWFGPFHQKWTA